MSRDDARAAGMTCQSLFMEHVQHISTVPSALTTRPKLREALAMTVPGVDNDTGVRCWDVDKDAPLEFRPGSCYGVTARLTGGFDLRTGTYDVGAACFESTWDEAKPWSRASTDTVASALYAGCFRDTKVRARADVDGLFDSVRALFAARRVVAALSRDLAARKATDAPRRRRVDIGATPQVGIPKVQSWEQSFVDQGLCSIGGALLSIACGAGGLHKVARRYRVDALKWMPYDATEWKSYPLVPPLLGSSRGR